MREWICQVCQYAAEPKDEVPPDSDEWALHHFDLCNHHVDVLTCPFCSSHLNPDDVLAGYKAHVRKGFVQALH